MTVNNKPNLPREAMPWARDIERKLAELERNADATRTNSVANNRFTANTAAHAQEQTVVLTETVTAVGEAAETAASAQEEANAAAVAAAVAQQAADDLIENTIPTLEQAIAAAEAAAAQAAADAVEAQSKADTAAADLLALAGKTGRVIRSATAPTGDDKNVNNLWFNTGDGKLYQLAGTTWTEITDPAIVTAQNRADSAYNLADTAASNATTANNLASAAQTKADSAYTLAETADAAALAANSAAGSAQSTANSAASAAQTAQGAADSAASAAAAAAGVGSAAQATADLGYWQARAVNARLLNPDSAFAEGSGGLLAYRAGAGAVALSRVAAPAGTPTTSGFILEAVETRTDTGTFTGFFPAAPVLQARSGAIFVQRFVAKIPVGYSFLTASNATGSAPGAEGLAPTSGRWLTSNAGTGQWQTYVRLIVCGTTGSFSSTGHIYVTGPVLTAGNPLAVQLAQHEVLDVTNAAVRPDVLIQSSAPAVEMRKATTLWIDITGNTNTPKRWDGSAWVEVTDKAAKDAAAAAVAAQTTANTAITNAQAAHDAADQAIADALGAQNTANTANNLASTADGRYTVATANPTTANAAGKPLNAVWEVRSAGITLRRYVLTTAGASPVWTQVRAGQDFIGPKAIGQAQIGDAAIGTLQVADAAIVNAKIGDLDAAKLWAGTVQTSHLAADIGRDLDISSNGAVNILTSNVNDVEARRAALAAELAALESGVDSSIANVEANQSSLATQIGAVDAEVAAVAGDLAEQQTRFRFDNNGLTISKPGGKTALNLDDTAITMVQDGDAVSWWEGGVMHANRFEGTVVALGTHQFVQEGNSTIVRAL